MDMGCGKKGVGIAGLAGWWVCGEAGGTHKDVKRTNTIQSANQQTDNRDTILIYFFFPRDFRGMKWNERKEEEGH